MSEIKETPKAINWPTIQIGAESYTLRYSYASNYQLAKWKKTLGTATNIELGAAMCGRFDDRGRWHSAAFSNPVDLADLISELDPAAQQGAENGLLNAITDALKKAFPALEIAQTPALPGMTTQATTTKSSELNSGPSPLQKVG